MNAPEYIPKYEKSTVDWKKNERKTLCHIQNRILKRQENGTCEPAYGTEMKGW